MSMTSFTSEVPQLVDRLTEAAPAGFTHLRESADPVVDRVNEALGRSTRRSRPSWPWIVLGVVGAIAVIVVVTRQRRTDDSVDENSPVRLAS